MSQTKEEKLKEEAARIYPYPKTPDKEDKYLVSRENFITIIRSDEAREYWKEYTDNRLSKQAEKHKEAIKKIKKRLKGIDKYSDKLDDYFTSTMDGEKPSDAAHRLKLI